MMRVLLAIAVCMAATSSPSWAQAPAGRVRIGVLALRGPEAALKEWGPTADYLETEIPSYTFDIVPYEMSRIAPAVAAGEIEFLLTNPANYVEMEMQYGATRVATLVTIRNDRMQTSYAGVIVARADRTDIRSLRDLKGKSFLGWDENSFGGWWMAWRELKARGIDPYRDLASRQFTLTTHDDVAYGVRDRKADAGCLRADILEQLILEGKIRRDELQILNPQPVAREYPYPRSTPLYPEWPMATLKHVPDDLSRDVTVALLRMPVDSEAARAAHCAGWTVPLSYVPIHECMRELQLGPYRDRGPARVSLLQLARDNWLLLVLATAAVLLAPVVLVTRANRRLHAIQKRLYSELAERKQAQELLRESEEQYRLLVGGVQDYAIFMLDPQGHVISWTRGAEKIKGYRSDEILGKMFTCFYTIEDVERGKPLRELEIAASEGRFEDEGWRVRKDGAWMWASVLMTALRDEPGNLKGFSMIVRDITRRKQDEDQLQAVNRALRVICECNEVLVRSTDEHALLVDVCRILVNLGEYRMAWVGYARQDEQKSVQLEASAGHEAGYVQAAHFTWSDTPHGHSQVGTVIRTAQPALCRDILTDRRFLLWRDQAAQRGYGSCITLPLFTGGRAFGVLEIYAAKAGAFGKEEERLLTQLASDLAYGIGSIRTRVQRDQAVENLQLDESRLQALLQLTEMGDAPLQNITDFAMEEGVRLTKSKIGYLAFTSPDGAELVMHSWSRTAMSECMIQDKPIHYPIVDTGLWGEAVRQRKPIFTNDYAAPNPLKKGYPQGHVLVKRHMNIPVFDGDRIVAVAGVGNKETPYDDADVRQLQLLMDGMWKLLQRKGVTGQVGR